MKKYHKHNSHIYRRIRFPNGETGHIVCAELEHNFDYINSISSDYSFHIIIAGQGEFIGPNGVVSKISEGSVFQRPSNTKNTTTVNQDFGPWTERIIYMSNNISDRLSALGFLPLFPIFMGESYAKVFGESYQSLIDCIQKYDLSIRYDQEVLMTLISICKLIHTKKATGIVVPKEETNMVASACSILDEDLCSDLKLPDLAIELGVNYNTLRKRFSDIKGCSLVEYRINRRIEHAKELLIGGMPIDDVSDELNYSSRFALSKQFKEITGLSPRTFANMAHGI